MNKLHRAYRFSKESCTKSDKLPQVMSLESPSVGAGGHKFEIKKSEGVELERSELTKPLYPAPHLCFRLQ